MTHIVRMKRTNVILDEKLLEEARIASGEKTYSATIMKALTEMVRVNTLRRHLAAARALGDEGFRPGYIEWYEKQHPGVVWPKREEPKPKRAVSASEKRLPAKKTGRAGRGSR